MRQFKLKKDQELNRAIHLQEEAGHLAETGTELYLQSLNNLANLLAIRYEKYLCLSGLDRRIDFVEWVTLSTYLCHTNIKQFTSQV